MKKWYITVQTYSAVNSMARQAAAKVEEKYNHALVVGDKAFDAMLMFCEMAKAEAEVDNPRCRPWILRQYEGALYMETGRSLNDINAFVLRWQAIRHEYTEGGEL